MDTIIPDLARLIHAWTRLSRIWTRLIHAWTRISWFRHVYFDLARLIYAWTRLSRIWTRLIATWTPLTPVSTRLPLWHNKSTFLRLKRNQKRRILANFVEYIDNECIGVD